MQTRQFLSYCRRFRLDGFLHPHLGGPTPWSSHLIPAEIEVDAFERQQAANTQYAAVRPFANLDLESSNHWQITEQTKRWLDELGHGFTYGPTVHLIPGFEGDGETFSLVGTHKYRHSQGQDFAVWTAIDQETTLSALLDIMRDIYQRRAFASSEFFDTWRLWYVLKTSWKAADPEKRAYDIFLPDEGWVKENALFGPKRL